MEKYIEKCPITPVWGRVVVRPLDIEQTDSLYKNTCLAIPDEVLKQDQRQQSKAVFIKAGDDAFDSWQGRKPKPGEEVVIEKHLGTAFEVEIDGKKIVYRLINDDNVVAILEEVE